MSTELMTPNHVESSTSEMESPTRVKYFVPRADIYESADHLLLMADIAGVDQGSLDITLEQNVLTIYGRVKQPEFEGYRLVHTEYGIGDYRRVFSLSNEIDRDGIEATVKNGVLKLVLPKCKRALPRKIEVRVE